MLVEQPADKIAAYEKGYLQHLLLFTQHQSSDGHLFRTLVDNWYGYHRAGPFLNSRGRPHWFNNVQGKDHGKLGTALAAMDYISEEAAIALRSQAGNLVKDHAIPIRALRIAMLEERPSSIEAIREYLLRWYRLGVITQSEHNRLRQLGLVSAMPSDWDERDVFARYLTAGIKLASGEPASLL